MIPRSTERYSLRPGECGRDHAHFIYVGVIDAVCEADGGRFVRVPIRQLYVHPPEAAVIRAYVHGAGSLKLKGVVIRWTPRVQTSHGTRERGIIGGDGTVAKSALCVSAQVANQEPVQHNMACRGPSPQSAGRRGAQRSASRDASE